MIPEAHDPASKSFDSSDVAQAEEFRVLRRRQWRADLQSGSREKIDLAFVRDTMVKPDIVWEPKPSDCTTPQTRFLMEYWLGLSNGAGVPPAQAIDPVAIAPALGYAHLIEPIERGEEFVYRIFGTVVSTVTGGDFSGRRMSEMQASDYVIDFGIACCGAVYDRRVPLLTRRRPARATEVACWERLLLPFVDDANEVTRLLIGIVPVSISGTVVRPRSGY